MKMALLRDLILKAKPTLQQLILAECELINLKPVNKLTIKFDPFREDGNPIREFSHYIHSYKVLQSNPKCTIKTEILSDRSEPTLTFELVDGQQLIFQCGHLKSLEIFKLFNEHVTPLATADAKEKKGAPLQQEKLKQKLDKKGKR